MSFVVAGGPAVRDERVAGWADAVMVERSWTMAGVAPDSVLAQTSDDFLAFWTERRICMLATVSADGTPHVVAVGATIDPGSGLARVITRIHSKKVRNLLAAGESGARVAVTANEGPRWSTLQGLGVVRTDRERVAEAERRYAQRYRTPEPNPERVVIEIAVDHLLGSVQ